MFCYVLIVIHDILYSVVLNISCGGIIGGIPWCYFTGVVCLSPLVSHLCASLGQGAYSPPFILFHFHLREVGSHPSLYGPPGLKTPNTSYVGDTEHKLCWSHRTQVME
jgi:hypothetical protein